MYFSANVYNIDCTAYTHVHTRVRCSNFDLHPSAAAPEIVTPLMNASRHQGDSHTFLCAAVAYPLPVFTFRFNEDKIDSNSSKHTLVTNSTHGTLTVHNLQTSDEGTYTCSASNRYGSVSTAAVLSLQGMLVRSTIPPVCNHSFCLH